jgi:integrase/recombinase XerD
MEPASQVGQALSGGNKAKMLPVPGDHSAAGKASFAKCQACHAVGQDSASKGRSGRMIPINDELRSALIEYRRQVQPFAGPHVISTERSLSTSPQAIVNMFQRWYRHLGFLGCSSHSGRRTFITNAARKISTVGGSLRDVQVLAGHTNLRTTQGYIEADLDAQKRVVQQV